MFPAAKGETLCRSIAQPHAIHLTPSQGPPLIVLFFKNIWTRDRRPRRRHRQHRWQNLGPEYHYLLKNLRGQLRELGPNRSLEWPHTLAGDAPSEPFMILSTVTTAGTPSQIGQRLAFWCKLPAIPYQNTTSCIFRVSGAARRALGAFMVAGCDPSIALFRPAIERQSSIFLMEFTFPGRLHRRATNGGSRD
jgi:hypothetical protein